MVLVVKLRKYVRIIYKLGHTHTHTRTPSKRSLLSKNVN